MRDELARALGFDDFAAFCVAMSDAPEREQLRVWRLFRLAIAEWGLRRSSLDARAFEESFALLEEVRAETRRRYDAWIAGLVATEEAIRG